MYGVGESVCLDGFGGWVVASVTPCGRPWRHLVRLDGGGVLWATEGITGRLRWRAA